MKKKENMTTRRFVMQLDPPPDPALGLAVPAADVRSVLRGLPVSVCQGPVFVFLQVQDDQQMDLGGPEELPDHFPGRWLPARVLVHGAVRARVAAHHQCAGIHRRLCPDEGHQGLEYLPDGLLYAEPHRWHRSGLYLAHDLRRHPQQLRHSRRAGNTNTASGD